MITIKIKTSEGQRVKQKRRVRNKHKHGDTKEMQSKMIEMQGKMREVWREQSKKQCKQRESNTEAKRAKITRWRKWRQDNVPLLAGRFPLNLVRGKETNRRERYILQGKVSGLLSP